ncbi:MAG: DUF1080 domain-containing protein [Cyclobacteriaceae bacterium]|nr:DUF1080 domain-containing protein [Cyclobacteriaceae bacterium]
MNTLVHTFAALACTLFCTFSVTMAQQASGKYLGRWALHFEEGMGWLEVRQEKGYLDADLLWRWGSVTPVADVYVIDGKLTVTRTFTAKFEDAHGKPRHQTITSILQLNGSQNHLVGTMTEPKNEGDGATVFYVHANRIADLPPTPDLSNVKFGSPIDLLANGLQDWQLMEKGAINGWKMENGVLVNDPVQKEGTPHIQYGNIRTNAVFEDFNLKLEVNVPEGSNSGVYLKGLYEVQVVDSYGKDLDSHHMGALYSRIVPSEAAEKKAGTWQTMDITLLDRHLTVMLNGKKIIDNQAVWGITGGAITSDESKPGPLYLQGDHGKVSYKNIVLKPILN